MGISSVRRYAVSVDRICLRTTRDGQAFMEIEGHYANANGSTRQIDVHLTDPDAVAAIREFYEKFGVEFHVNAYDVVLAKWTSIFRRDGLFDVPNGTKIVFVGRAANAGAAPLKVRADAIRDFPPPPSVSANETLANREKALFPVSEATDATPNYVPASRIFP
ncbi:MAG: hypothetical protein ING19_08740 [Azospirillum sp.]|nr:hypothetical protein [Azospirillum sp.]